MEKEYIMIIALGNHINCLTVVMSSKRNFLACFVYPIEDTHRPAGIH